MKFSKVQTGQYQATRADGQVITIESRKCEETGSYWAVTYEGDWDGDLTAHAPTKKQLVAYENNIELCSEAMEQTYTMEG